MEREKKRIQLACTTKSTLAIVLDVSESRKDAQRVDFINGDNGDKVLSCMVKKPL